MDGTSWRAKFAKSNINILNLTLVKTDQGLVHRWFFEFTYHPKPGIFKWCKTYLDIPQRIEGNDEEPAMWAYVSPSTDEMAQTIIDTVLELRKELED